MMVCMLQIKSYLWYFSRVDQTACVWMKIPRCTSAHPNNISLKFQIYSTNDFRVYIWHKLKISHFHKRDANNSANVKTWWMEIPMWVYLLDIQFYFHRVFSSFFFNILLFSFFLYWTVLMTEWMFVQVGGWGNRQLFLQGNKIKVDKR